MLEWGSSILSPSFSHLIHEGRCDTEAIIKKATVLFRPEDVCVVACGVKGLVDKAEAISVQEGFAFHRETFEL